ncbi:MFS transporter [Haloprofundus halophilus]|uniref:MFS transporter n=1 Tax=Haloprofundus halophilus TaxID=2283527 RepID=UPI0018E504F3|nr:MFS transporter [Haloprofundus halophilus]
MYSWVKRSNVYYGWFVAFACFLGATVVFGVSYSFGVFFDRMLVEFGRSRGETSLIFGVQTFVMYVGAAVVGGFVDRHGTRPLLLASMGFLAVGLGGLALSTSFLQVLLFYGVVTSLGLSVVYVVAFATVPRWFERRRGFAGGLASSGTGVGMLVATPAASALIVAVGWRWTYGAFLLAALAMLAVAAALVADSPRRLDVNADVEFDGGAPVERETMPWRTQFRETVAVARTPAFLLVLFGWVFIYASLYVVFAHLVVYTADAGLGRGVGVLGLTLVGAATSVARLGIGGVADRLGRTRVFVACSATMGLSTVVLAATESAAAVFAFALVYGTAYGGNGALLSPLTADLFGAENINVVFGLVSVSFAISGLLAPPSAGLAYDVFASYAPAFAVSGALGVLGAAMVGVAARLTTDA